MEIESKAMHVNRLPNLQNLRRHGSFRHQVFFKKASSSSLAFQTVKLHVDKRLTHSHFEKQSSIRQRFLDKVGIALFCVLTLEKWLILLGTFIFFGSNSRKAHGFQVPQIIPHIGLEDRTVFTFFDGTYP